MSRRTRLPAALTAALLGALVVGLLTIAPGAALAGTHGTHRADGKQGELAGRGPDATYKRSSYLCYGYADCKGKGMGNAGYAGVNDKMFWNMYSGHNCTNYAAYRMVHSGLPNVRPWSGGGNAMYWGTSMPRITDDVPRVGAVTWWKANAGPAGSVGHVGYVEKVVSDNEIIVSQDSWGGDFSWAVITRASGNWPSGFIHFNDLPLTNQVAPEIDGVAKVGSVLSSTPGTWKPVDVDVAYQWFADGKRISGATGATLQLTQARLDQVITVATTASKLGFPSRSATSAATDAVLPGLLRNVTAPTISGTARVDSTLSLETGDWSPAPESLDIRWLADGQPIEGSSGAATLPVTPDLVGARISAKVAATRSGYAPVSAAAAPTGPVAPGTFTVTNLPSIHGDAQVGQTLSLDPGTFRPTDAAVAVQWLRGGVPIDGATASSYQLQNVDLGRRISALVTLTRPGYTSQAAETASTGLIRTDPRIRTSVEHLRRGTRVTTTVVAPGLAEVTGPVVVRIAGVTQAAELRHGVARVVLVDVPHGRHRLTVRYGGSDAVNRLIYTRDVWVH